MKISELNFGSYGKIEAEARGTGTSALVVQINPGPPTGKHWEVLVAELFGFDNSGTPVGADSVVTGIYISPGNSNLVIGSFGENSRDDGSIKIPDYIGFNTTIINPSSISYRNAFPFIVPGGWTLRGVWMAPDGTPQFPGTGARAILRALIRIVDETCR
jgi:hypothetical protein